MNPIIEQPSHFLKFFLLIFSKCLYSYVLFIPVSSPSPEEEVKTLTIFSKDTLAMITCCNKTSLPGSGFTLMTMVNMFLIITIETKINILFLALFFLLLFLSVYHYLLFSFSVFFFRIFLSFYFLISFSFFHFSFYLFQSFFLSLFSDSFFLFPLPLLFFSFLFNILSVFLYSSFFLSFCFPFFFSLFLSLFLLLES